MLVRTIRSCLMAIAVMLTCGCSSESPYNEPADPSQDAAAIGAGTTPQPRVAARRKKVTKPPGPPLKVAKGVHLLD